MVCSGHGLYYEQFPKNGRPNHPETFLRQIRNYEERFSEETHVFTPESSPELFVPKDRDEVNNRDVCECDG